MKNTSLFLFLLPFLAACRKGGRDAGSVDLCGAWLQTSESANGQSLWSTYYHEPCQLDDRWIFRSDGTYSVADSGATCSGAISAARAGSWRVEGGQLLLDSFAYSIMEWSENALSIERERMQNGFTFRYRLGFSRR